ncbi:MAG: hypothetical protein JWN31_1639 [Frankiales bacterium]|nr:hypothetical protein [Frankiales bacterium]
MTRRLIYIALGATVGILVVRKATEAAQKLTPAGLQSSATSRFASFREELRAGMAEREAELRTELGLDGSHDVIDS